VKRRSERCWRRADVLVALTVGGGASELFAHAEETCDTVAAASDDECRGRELAVMVAGGEAQWHEGEEWSMVSRRKK